jgi:hypothetical protein
MNLNQDFPLFRRTRRLSFTEVEQRKRVLPVRQPIISKWDTKMRKPSPEVERHGKKQDIRLSSQSDEFRERF